MLQRRIFSLVVNKFAESIKKRPQYLSSGWNYVMALNQPAATVAGTQPDVEDLDVKRNSDVDAAPESKRQKLEDNKSGEQSDEKYISKKWVVLMSYCGNGYYGMQR